MEELRKGCLERTSDPNSRDQVAIVLVVGLDVLILALSVTLSSFGRGLLQNFAVPKNPRLDQTCAQLTLNNHTECVHRHIIKRIYAYTCTIFIYIYVCVFI